MSVFRDQPSPLMSRLLQRPGSKSASYPVAMRLGFHLMAIQFQNPLWG